MSETKVKCPCDLDTHNNCFLEQTEVKGEPFDSYLCFHCGMTTNSYMALDSEKLETMVSGNTQFMNDLKIIDEERGLVWFPSLINMLNVFFENTTLASAIAILLVFFFEDISTILALFFSICDNLIVIFVLNL